MAKTVVFHWLGMEISVCKWQCSITIWKVDRFCHCWKPLTVSPRAMVTYRLAIRSQHSSLMWFYSKWQCQMHLIVMWRHWCPSFTCGQCLTTVKKTWFYIFSLLFETVPVQHWEIILEDSVIGWSILLTSLPVTYVLQCYQYSQE